MISFYDSIQELARSLACVLETAQSLACVWETAHYIKSPLCADVTEAWDAALSRLDSFAPYSLRHARERKPSTTVIEKKFNLPFKIRFCTYGNHRFVKSLERIQREACNTRWFDTITAYMPNNLSYGFSKRFSRVLNMHRGGGYWVWKGDLIEQEMANAQDGDIIVYTDSGCTINALAEARFLDYVDMLSNSSECVISFNIYYPEWTYTTRQVFEYFGVLGD
jgi:hypothetical protein